MKRCSATHAASSHVATRSCSPAYEALGSAPESTSSQLAAKASALGAHPVDACHASNLPLLAPQARGAQAGNSPWGAPFWGFSDFGLVSCRPQLPSLLMSVCRPGTAGAHPQGVHPHARSEPPGAAPTHHQHPGAGGSGVYMPGTCLRVKSIVSQAPRVIAFWCHTKLTVPPVLVHVYTLGLACNATTAPTSCC